VQIGAVMQTEKDIHKKVFLAAEFIEQNANDVISLHGLAIESAISPFHLQRKFKEVFGVSPKQFQKMLCAYKC
jgi:methylphosphotriester-DNA--protein-cysteine methyltransferase